jgi:DNA-binding response OmpR family regulator
VDAINEIGIALEKKRRMHMQQDQIYSQSNVAEQVKTILVVEDDVAVGDFLVAAITQETHHRAYMVTNGLLALQACTSDMIDLIILDYNLPFMNGIQFYDQLRTLQTHIPPVVMLSAYLPTDELAKRNLPSLRKPIELQHLLDTIERMVR